MTQVPRMEGGGGGLFDLKTEGRKSRDIVSLRYHVLIFPEKSLDYKLKKVKDARAVKTWQTGYTV
jgi:hypothetical protein